MAANIPSRRRKRNRENGQDTEGHTATAPFEAGTDFIRLEPDSDSEERERRKNRGRDGRGNGRGKDEDKERTRDANSPRPPSASPPPLPSRKPISEGADGNGRANGREREWDRGKRKYDMVFDPSDGYQNKKQRTDAKSRLAPWVDHVEWDGCNNAAELLHREVEGFVKWISPTPQEDEIRGLVVAIISRAVTASFPDATVFPFGSYATKLYLPLGDIDLVIRSQSMAYADKHAVLTALATTIKRSGITNKVTIIAKAKVPIVKFITNHEYGRFNVDLSINQENGIVAGGIINGFLKDFGGAGNCLALRALVLLTKLFLSQRGMNEVYTGGLGSYAIVCLVISFLQMHPKIRHAQIDPDKNLGVLVVEFFELYGNRFHYEEVGISLRDGGSYFGKRQRGWGWGEQWGGARRGGAGGLLSIEDPGDPTNDISAGSYNFQNVRRNLAGAHEILTATIYLRAGILEARRGGRAVRFRDHYAPDDMSILSSVLGVTQELVCCLCLAPSRPASSRPSLPQIRAIRSGPAQDPAPRSFASPPTARGPKAPRRRRTLRRRLAPYKPVGAPRRLAEPSNTHTAAECSPPRRRVCAPQVPPSTRMSRPASQRCQWRSPAQRRQTPYLPTSQPPGASPRPSSASSPSSLPSSPSRARTSSVYLRRRRRAYLRHRHPHLHDQPLQWARDLQRGEFPRAQHRRPSIPTLSASCAARPGARRAGASTCTFVKGLFSGRAIVTQAHPRNEDIIVAVQQPVKPMRAQSTRRKGTVRRGGTTAAAPSPSAPDIPEDEDVGDGGGGRLSWGTRHTVRDARRDAGVARLCVNPNDAQLPNQLEGRSIKGQVHSAGLTQVAQRCARVYEVGMTPAEFCARYGEGLETRGVTEGGERERVTQARTAFNFGRAGTEVGRADDGLRLTRSGLRARIARGGAAWKSVG